MAYKMGFLAYEAEKSCPFISEGNRLEWEAGFQAAKQRAARRAAWEASSKWECPFFWTGSERCGFNDRSCEYENCKLSRLVVTHIETFLARHEVE